MGSSPMVEITSYDVIINWSYTKSHLSNILLSRPLGATHCCSSLHDHIYKVPAHYCILTWPLGATLVEVFYENKAISSPRLLQAWQSVTWGLHIWSIRCFASDWDEQHGFLQSGSNYMETSLKSSLCSVQDLGATGNMDIREEYLPIFSFEQTRLTRHHQSLWPGVYNNHNPASSIIMNRHWQQSWTGVGNNHDPELSAFITRQWW